MFITSQYYARTKPQFNHYYKTLREEAQAELAINWLREIPQEMWTLT